MRESFFSPLEEILSDLSNGKMVVIVDDEKRENEGDIIFAAEFATPEKINFMVKFARGLVCLAIDKKKSEKLKLKFMSERNRSKHKTAFTISIEAKTGITTGISAKDRAKTIQVAVSNNAKASDLVSPGHIFPLIAREGGVLVRAGHTEAAVDLSRLCGGNPQGVICEIMNDDGTMARFNDLVKFCKKHKLKMSSIKDLIEYRVREEKFVKCIYKGRYDTEFAGVFDLYIYLNLIDNTEHLVLVKGKFSIDETVLVRMHTFDFSKDFLGIKDSNNSELVLCLKRINQEGKGVIVILRNPRKELLNLKKKQKNDNKILKEYGIGAQILLDIGVKNIVLLSNTSKNIIGIDGFGLVIKKNLKIN